MWPSRLPSTLFVTVMLAVALAPAAVMAQAQPKAPPQAAPAQPAPAPPPGPYKPVTITLPPAPSDPSFDAFRKQLGLKLERQPLTLPSLVLDHFEQAPTAN